MKKTFKRLLFNCYQENKRNNTKEIDKWEV